MKKYITNQKLLEALNSRYATKVFDENKSLTPEDEETIKEILRLTPTSLGLQLHRYIIVEDKKLREKLKEASFWKQQITWSSLLVVFAVKTGFWKHDIQKYLDKLQEVRWVDDEKKKSIMDRISTFILEDNEKYWIENYEEWQTRQAYIALWNIITSLSLMWLDSCPIEWLDPSEYDKILGLEKKWLKTKVALAIWYRSEDDSYQNEKKVRYSQEEMFIEM